MLEVSHLTKRYGDTLALNNVSFQVEEGELFGLLGPNGAGKTTLLSILSGQLSPTSGEGRLAGKSLLSHREVRRDVGIVPQEISIYTDLSARENLCFFGNLYGVNGSRLKEKTTQVLESIGLQDRADKRASTFSGGMKRRLNLGIALMHEPKLLMLDEPTVGVDPQSRNRIFEEVRRLHTEGTTIIYTSHYVEEVQALCSRIGIIDHGQLIACDKLSALLSRLDGQIELRLKHPHLQLLDRLHKLEDVRVDMNDSLTVVLECPDVKATLPKVALCVAELNVDLAGMEIHEPSLERVFLKLTGEALRD